MNNNNNEDSGDYKIKLNKDASVTAHKTIYKKPDTL